MNNFTEDDGGVPFRNSPWGCVVPLVMIAVLVIATWFRRMP